ncbi:hypothetical protein GCM10009133_29340 [Cocleimonas flava]
MELSIKDEVHGGLIDSGIKTVKVSVEGRNVLLEGFIPTHEDRKRAENIVNNISGISQVKSQLVVKNQTND